MALWLAVQQLKDENDAKDAIIKKQSFEQAALKTRLSAMEVSLKRLEQLLAFKVDVDRSKSLASRE